MEKVIIFINKDFPNKKLLQFPKIKQKIQEGKETILKVLECKANTQPQYENLKNGNKIIEYLNVVCSLQINLNTMI